MCDEKCNEGATEGSAKVGLVGGLEGGLEGWKMLVSDVGKMERMLEQGRKVGGGEQVMTMQMKQITEQGAAGEQSAGTNEDDMEVRWLAYLIYCNVENKCYLLREEKMAILIVLKYGRRLDP